MDDFAETLSELALRGAMIALLALVFWAAAVVLLGLGAAAGSWVFGPPAFAWLHDDVMAFAALLSLTGMARVGVAVMAANAGR